MFSKTDMRAFGRNIEIYYKKVKESYEVWLLSEGEIINHYLSSGNPESGIVFSNGQPLEWFSTSEYPQCISGCAETTKIKSNRACFDPIYQSKLNRRAWNLSKKEILGTWYDQTISFALEPDNKFVLNTKIPRDHVLFSIAGLNPIFWDYKSWYLSIGGDAGGVRFPTLGCVGGNHLAIKIQGNGPVAHVFRKG